MSAHEEAMKRLKDSPFDVEDHPYDRGFFDCIVIGSGLRYEQYEATEADRKLYEDGYQAAVEEIRTGKGLSW